MTAHIVRLSDYQRPRKKPLMQPEKDTDTGNPFSTFLGYALLGVASLYVMQRLWAPRIYQ